MDTKAYIIETSTELFQQKGYKNVGLNEILKKCKISKGSLYHHFPNGKEELLITCLENLNESIINNIENVFREFSSTKEATKAEIERLIEDFEKEKIVKGYTFSSIVSEMSSFSDSVREVCNRLYKGIQNIFLKKLIEDGLSHDEAYSISLIITTSIEGALMLCQTEKSSNPLKTIANTLPDLLKEF